MLTHLFWNMTPFPSKARAVSMDSIDKVYVLIGFWKNSLAGPREYILNRALPTKIKFVMLELWLLINKCIKSYTHIYKSNCLSFKKKCIFVLRNTIYVHFVGTLKRIGLQKMAVADTWFTKIFCIVSFVNFPSYFEIWFVSWKFGTLLSS